MGSKQSTIETLDLEESNKFAHFTSQEIQLWSKMFKKRYPSGVIKLNDLERHMQQLFPFGNPKPFSNIIFRTLNIRGSGEIDFNEFLISFSILKVGSIPEKLRWIFRFYDIDNDGVVSKSEVLFVANALYEMVGGTIDAEMNVDITVDEFFDEVENKSGFLTIEDFMLLANKKSAHFKQIFVVLDEFFC